FGLRRATVSKYCHADGTRSGTEKTTTAWPEEEAASPLWRMTAAAFAATSAEPAWATCSVTRRATRLPAVQASRRVGSRTIALAVTRNRRTGSALSTRCHSVPSGGRLRGVDVVEGLGPLRAGCGGADIPAIFASGS